MITTTLTVSIIYALLSLPGMAMEWPSQLAEECGTDKQASYTNNLIAKAVSVDRDALFELGGHYLNATCGFDKNIFQSFKRTIIAREQGYRQVPYPTQFITAMRALSPEQILAAKQEAYEWLADHLPPEEEPAVTEVGIFNIEMSPPNEKTEKPKTALEKLVTLQQTFMEDYALGQQHLEELIAHYENEDDTFMLFRLHDTAGRTYDDLFVDYELALKHYEKAYEYFSVNAPDARFVPQSLIKMAEFSYEKGDRLQYMIYRREMAKLILGDENEEQLADFMERDRSAHLVLEEEDVLKLVKVYDLEIAHGDPYEIFSDILFDKISVTKKAILIHRQKGDNAAEADAYFTLSQVSGPYYLGFYTTHAEKLRGN